MIIRSLIVNINQFMISKLVIRRMAKSTLLINRLRSCKLLQCNMFSSISYENFSNSLSLKSKFLFTRNSKSNYQIKKKYQLSQQQKQKIHTHQHGESDDTIKQQTKNRQKLNHNQKLHNKIRKKAGDNKFGDGKQYQSIKNKKQQKQSQKVRSIQSVFTKLNINQETIKSNKTLKARQLVQLSLKLQHLIKNDYIADQDFTNLIRRSLVKVDSNDFITLNEYIQLMKLSLQVQKQKLGKPCLKNLGQLYIKQFFVFTSLIVKQMSKKCQNNSYNTNIVGQKIRKQLSKLPYEYMHGEASNIIQGYLGQLKKNTIRQSQLQLDQQIIQKYISSDILIQLLRNLGSLVSKNLIKAVDQHLFNNLKLFIYQKTTQSLQLQGWVSKTVAIFNQLSLNGLFTQYVDQNFILITDDQNKLLQQVYQKNSLKMSLNLIEIGCFQHIYRLERFFLKKYQGNNQQVLRLVNSPLSPFLIVAKIFHKHKLGSFQFWNAVKQKTHRKTTAINIDMLFPTICGMYRNFKYNAIITTHFLKLDQQLSYVCNFSGFEFVQFYLVMHQNVMRLDYQMRIKYINIILTSLDKFQQQHYKKGQIQKGSFKDKKQEIPVFKLLSFYRFIYSAEKVRSQRQVKDYIETQYKGKKSTIVEFLKKAKLPQAQINLLCLIYSEWVGVSDKQETKLYLQQVQQNCRITDLYANELDKDMEQHKRRMIIQEIVRSMIVKDQQEERVLYRQSQ